MKREFANKMRIPHTVADSATAQFNDTNVLSVVCRFYKLFANFPSDFERYNELGICL